MLRPRFLWKLYASYLALLMLSIAIVGMLVARHTSQTIHGTVRDTLQTRAFLLRQLALQVLDASDPQSFSPDLRSLGAAIGTHITIIRPNGTVVADSEDDPSRLQNYARRPEIVAAHQRDTRARTFALAPGSVSRPCTWRNPCGARMSSLAIFARPCL
jgi:two-component system phosphate regulon sensor histidine kinase PhoR